MHHVILSYDSRGDMEKMYAKRGIGAKSNHCPIAHYYARHFLNFYLFTYFSAARTTNLMRLSNAHFSPCG